MLKFEHFFENFFAGFVSLSTVNGSSGDGTSIYVATGVDWVDLTTDLSSFYDFFGGGEGFTMLSDN